MKRILDLIGSPSKRRDRGDAVLVTVLLSIPLLAICFTFATSISMAVWQKTSYISAAQMAATDSLTAVQTNGYLGPASIQKFVSEYLSQTRGVNNAAVQAAGQGVNSETAPFVCETAVINGVERQLPYIEVQLDINRGSGESGISTYSYTSEGLGAVVNAPEGGHGTAVYGQQYRVINAKVWEASRNLTILGYQTPIQGTDTTCQGYNIDVSAILFGSNEDLDNGATCFQPDAFPVNPAKVQQVATPTAQVKVSPLPTCANAPVDNIKENSIVTVTGTYRQWSQVIIESGTDYKGQTGWVLTSSLEDPSTWTISYNLDCDANGCATTTTPNPTSYNWGTSTAAIPLSNPTKNHYNYGGWQQVNCTTGNPMPGYPASTSAQIEYGAYGDLCYRAVFTIHKIYVTFDAGTGASGGRVRTLYDWGTTVPVPACAVKPGYDFRGWQNSAGTLIATATNNASGCSVSGNVIVAGNHNSEVVYTARWANSSYSVNRTYGAGCYASGGQSSYIFSTAAQNVALGGAASNGYQNITWTKTSGPGTISGSNINVPADGTGNIAVTASCAMVNYNVTVNTSPTGGSPSGAVNTYTIAGKTITLTRPTMTGRTFSSWTVTINSSGQASSVNTANNALTIPPGAYGNITVQANMSANNYAINYSCVTPSNSGCSGTATPSGLPATFSFSNGAQNVALGSLAARNGWTFNGWSVTGGSASVSGNTLTISANTASDVSVKANWQKEAAAPGARGETCGYANNAKISTWYCISIPQFRWNGNNVEALISYRYGWINNSGTWNCGWGIDRSADDKCGSAPRTGQVSGSGWVGGSSWGGSYQFGPYGNVNNSGQFGQVNVSHSVSWTTPARYTNI